MANNSNFKFKHIALMGAHVNPLVEQSLHDIRILLEKENDITLYLEQSTLETLKDKFEGKIPEEGVNFSSNTMKFLKYIPKKTGGCWIDLPKKLQIEAMGGAADTDDPKRKGKQGGRRGFYRRLSWKKPSPTLVTSPTQSGTLMCHPEYDRPLSVKEYAVIQGFPDNWKFQGSLADRYRMIGEAVPVKLAKIIAKTIKDSI